MWCVIWPISFIPPFSMTLAFRSLCSGWWTTSPLEAISGAALDTRISLQAVPQEIATCLYRVTQESLNNVVRHAEASQVDVELTGSRSELMVTITDNGVGFDSEQSRNGSHGLGLLGMKERVALVHGDLAVISAVGKGTRVQVVVLVPEGEA